MMTTDQFRAAIEAFIAESGLSPTQFGIDAVRDPNFVRDIRHGRAPSLKTAEKVIDFIKSREPAPAQGAAA